MLISQDVLIENICKALPLTGVNVIPNDLHACHQKKNVRQSYFQIQMLQVKKCYCM